MQFSVVSVPAQVCSIGNWNAPYLFYGPDCSHISDPFLDDAKCGSEPDMVQLPTSTAAIIASPHVLLHPMAVFAILLIPRT